MKWDCEDLVPHYKSQVSLARHTGSTGSYAYLNDICQRAFSSASDSEGLGAVDTEQILQYVEDALLAVLQAIACRANNVSEHKCCGCFRNTGKPLEYVGNKFSKGGNIFHPYTQKIVAVTGDKEAFSYGFLLAYRFQKLLMSFWCLKRQFYCNNNAYTQSHGFRIKPGGISFNNSGFFQLPDTSATGSGRQTGAFCNIRCCHS